MSLSENLQNLRKIKNMSQEELVYVKYLIVVWIN